MQLNISKSRVSWSRHRGVLIEPEQGPDVTGDAVARASRNLQQIKEARKRYTVPEYPRKSTSESDLWKKAEKEKSDGESWDSQSDPGFVSSEKFNGFAPRSFTTNEQIECDEDGKHTGSVKVLDKLKPKHQGRGKGQKGELRRRRGKRIDGDSDDGDSGNFVVEMPQEEESPEVLSTSCRTPKYVHNYFDFMYYSCISSYKWDEMEKEEETKCRYILSVVQKIITFYIAILATFSSFITVKLEIVAFLDDRTLSNFIDVGYFLVSCAIHWYFTYLFAFQKTTISKTMKAWDDQDEVVSNMTPSKYQMNWLPIVTGMLTVTIAIIRSILYTDFDDWSLEGLLLANSQQVSYGFFIWKPDHLYNSTLADDYGSNLNTSSSLMGILGIMGDICWNLQIGCFKDVLIWVAIVNKHHVLKFGEKVRNNLSKKMITGKNVSEDDNKCWQAYREILAINSTTNSTFNIMFMINHLDSFLVFSYWLTELLNKKVKLRVLMLVGYSVVKGILAYIPARRAASENDDCRDWIQSLPCQTERFCVGETPLTREVMLMELEKKPLGLGRGRVHINNEFLVSFITLVASLFCFLLQIKPKDEEETRY